MKKIFIFAIAAVMACMTLISCDKEETTSTNGTVTYRIGFSILQGDVELSGKISDIYKTNIISATGSSSTGSTIVVNGEFKTIDSAVKSACSKSEGEVANLTIGDNFYTLNINAAYEPTSGSASYNENFYNKSFGKKK